MDKPKKEPIALHQKQDYRLCLNCGFPNRHADSTCMYCNTSMVEDTGLWSWLRQTYYVLRWRWQLKQKRDNLSLSNQKSQMSATKGFGYFALGMILSGSGLYIFTLSITENSISNALIAILLILYGFFTLKAFLSKK